MIFPKATRCFYSTENPLPLAQRWLYAMLATKVGFHQLISLPQVRVLGHSGSQPQPAVPHPSRTAWGGCRKRRGDAPPKTSATNQKCTGDGEMQKKWPAHIQLPTTPEIQRKNFDDWSSCSSRESGVRRCPRGKSPLLTHTSSHKGHTTSRGPAGSMGPPEPSTVRG